MGRFGGFALLVQVLVLMQRTVFQCMVDNILIYKDDLIFSLQKAVRRKVLYIPCYGPFDLNKPEYETSKYADDIAIFIKGMNSSARELERCQKLEIQTHIKSR